MKSCFRPKPWQRRVAQPVRWHSCWRRTFLKRGTRKFWRSLLPVLTIFSFLSIFLIHAIFPVLAQPVNSPQGNDLQLITQSPVTQPPATQPPPIQQPRPEIRGVWLTSNDSNVLRDAAKLGEAVNDLAQLNLNTLYPVVYNSGYVWYPSPVAKRYGIQPFVFRGTQGQDVLADLIAKAHSRGLLVIPWFEFGFMAPPVSELTTLHPEWLTQRRDGSKTSISAAGEVSWLNPFHPEVQQFITDLVLEVITQYDVDGIQFDDHTSLPNEFGYDPYTIALYTKETKKKPHIDPQNPDWVGWRADKISAFMVRLHDAVKARKPNAIFSVSPASYDFAYKAQLQDWLGWVRLNIVDELIVQVYKTDLNSFMAKIGRSEIRESQLKIPTAVGVLTGLRNRPIEMSLIQAKVQAARDRGLGVAFFYYESLWNNTPETIDQRRLGFQTLFPTPAPRLTAGTQSK